MFDLKKARTISKHFWRFQIFVVPVVGDDRGHTWGYKFWQVNLPYVLKKKSRIVFAGLILASRSIDIIFWIDRKMQLKWRRGK